MEEIYADVEYDTSVDPGPSTNPTGPRSSERRFHGAVVLCLGLLSVFLLAKLISLGVHRALRGSDADMSTIKANLTERLQASENKLSSVSAERDLLNASLTEMTQELDRLQSLSKENKTCPAGWTMFSSACYLLSGGTGSWDEGREDCRNRSADLVTIGSVKEQTFVAGLIKTHTWIGLNDKDVEGTWKWIDGTPLTLMNWAEIQPDNGGGDPEWGEEDCAHIRPRSTQWNDWSCEIVLPWICADLSTIKANLTERLQASENKLSSVSAERDLLNASLTEMTKELDRLQSLSKEKKTCPAGWTMFSSACYLVSGGTGSWDEGREDCRNRGAHLVMIDSVKEQTFLFGLTKKHTWIGLNDKDVEGTWKWIDGTPLTWMNWAWKQPDNGGGKSEWGKEDCAHIRPVTTQWNDLSCETVLSWICEKIA